MRRWIAALLLAALAAWQAPAQGRVYSQAELDALLAPVALYPDPVLSHILIAATYPDELREAAAWSRANPQLLGEDAVRAADSMPWHPSVKALVAFPELLARMDESPQWTADLASAFLEQEPYVMDTVQSLRRRAHANGSLHLNDQYSVQRHGEAIALYPVQPHVIHLPYYNPYVAYGPWWWPSYRPVFWRPWHPRPAVFVSTHFFTHSVDWRRRHVVRHHHHHHHHGHDHRRSLAASVQQRAHEVQQPRPGVQAAPINETHAHGRGRSLSGAVQHHTREVQEPRPIVQGARIQAAPAAPAQRPQARREHRSEHRSAAPVTIHNHANPVRSMVQSLPELRHQPRAEPRRDVRPSAGQTHRQEGRQQSRPHHRRG